MKEKNIFNVKLYKLYLNIDDFPFEELGKGQLEILENENKEKILKFTKRNYEMTFSFIFS